MEKAMKKICFFLASCSILFSVNTSHAAVLRCASTTSTQNSGLFEYLLPLFKKDTSIEVQVIAVGTGAALRLGKKGDVDVVLVHAKDLELQMAAEGWFIGRHDVMYNDFVVLGPQNDPANINKAASATDAFQRIKAAQAPFVSRGDDSGTHKKELKIWGPTQPDPKKDTWYLAVGQGMGKTLRIAAEKQAYVLTDRGTWLALQDQDKLDLKILYEGDPALFNQYGVMAVNPKKHPGVKIKEAKIFINWLISENGQQAIGAYRDALGNKLFKPNAR